MSRKQTLSRRVAATTTMGWKVDMGQGDVLMIDNILSFHSRNPYTGCRDVLVALLELGTQ